MSDQTIKNAYPDLVPVAPDKSVASSQPAWSLKDAWPWKIQLAIFLPCLVIATIFIFAAVPSLVAPYAPTDMDDNAILAAPSLHHLFGTDQFGSDILTLVIYGARQSVLLALGAILLGASSGTLVGLVTGYAGGKLDAAVMRVIEVWMSIPPMLLALIIAAALGGGFSSTIIAIASMIVPRFSRIVRAQVISIIARPFIVAAQALGASKTWILRRHVLPHAGSLLLVLSTLWVGEAILAGSALSFIGLGANPDHPDWGFILAQGRNYLTDAWWYATFPGLAITFLVVSVNLLGDTLRSKFDPQHKLR
jgi:peptide/nickel transport system permease protein